MPDRTGFATAGGGNGNGGLAPGRRRSFNLRSISTRHASRTATRSSNAAILASLRTVGILAAWPVIPLVTRLGLRSHA